MKKWVKKYWWIIFIIILALPAVPITIKLIKNRFAEIDDPSWLIFIGSYLAFAGTSFVSAFAINQNKEFREEQREKDDMNRYRDIEAIFSVKQKMSNSSVEGSNIGTIEITNCGGYPIMDVIVNDKYMGQILKPGENINIPSKEIRIGNQIIIDYTDVDSNTRNQSYILRMYDGMPFFFYEGEIPI